MLVKESPDLFLHNKKQDESNITKFDYLIVQWNNQQIDEDFPVTEFGHHFHLGI